VATEGIYFVDRRAGDSPSTQRWGVRLFSLKEHRVSDVSTLRYAPRLAGPALSVSSDGRWILVSQQQEESDLMLVENFR
jgi:hypothetical protein